MRRYLSPMLIFLGIATLGAVGYFIAKRNGVSQSAGAGGANVSINTPINNSSTVSDTSNAQGGYASGGSGGTGGAGGAASMQQPSATKGGGGGVDPLSLLGDAASLLI